MAAASASATAPQWMVDFVQFRKRLFMQTVEPVIVTLLGPLETLHESSLSLPKTALSEEEFNFGNETTWHVDGNHRRLSLAFMPDYVEDPYAFRETSMSFATLTMLFILMSSILVIFLSCFYHNQKTSPLFISPRRHRLPKLVPPPLPIDGYFDWVSFVHRSRILVRM